MQYMLTYLETADEMARRDDPACADAYWGAWRTYMAAMTEAGALVNGNALLPPHTATTVRVHGERREVQDGPFADTKEQLGGYVIIEAADLDTALDWAARSPAAAAGAVEVRPVLTSPGEGNAAQSA